MVDSFTEEDSLEEGEATSDIQIKPPKEPEVNPEIYADTVSMVSRGFLIASVDLNDVQFIFKSLNHHEYEMVRILTGLIAGNQQTIPPRFWDVFLSYMVLFVDGQNILVDRQRNLSKLAETFRDIPHAAKARLVRQLSELNRKASMATMLVEAYATEAYSRWKWAQVQGLDLSSPAMTGIEGTDRIGLCYAQLTWRAINYYEDIRHRQDSEWDNAKFIGGCFAGKGIQKIYDRDTQRKRKEKEERWNKKDQMIRHVLFGDPLEDDKRYGGAQVVVVAKTVEELAEQVEKSLKGEKDWHDEVVQQYEEQVRSGYHQKTQELQSVMEANRQTMAPISGGTSLEGLSPEEVQRLMESKNPIPTVTPTERPSFTMWNIEGLPTTAKPTDNAIPLQSSRNAGKPWRP